MTRTPKIRLDPVRWDIPHLMHRPKSCLACRETWGMHHRCPALGGRFNCC